MSDAMLRRVARDAAVVCGLAAVLAWPLGGWRAAAGVLGGGLLVAISFGAVAYTIGTVLGRGGSRPSPGHGRAIRVLAAAVFVLHYALLAFIAYVMIARLRLHPVALVGGVTSFVLAVAVEAARRGRR